MKYGRSESGFFIRQATGIAIAVVTMIMLMAAVIFYRQGQDGNIAKNLVVHTYEVTGHIQLLFNRLKDVELGQRGYILTGDERYLAPYHDALKDFYGTNPDSKRLEQHHSLAQELNILRKLTSDNPLQQQNIDEMVGYVRQLLDYWAATIQTRRDKGPQGAKTDFAHENELMDNTARLVSIMQAQENHLLDIRTYAEEAAERRSSIIIFSGIALFYIMKVSAIWLYQRGSARHLREMEKNEEQLTVQQEELQASNEEMEASNEELEEKTRALELQNTQIRRQSSEIQEAKQMIEEKAAELERSNKYKSEFLANMSHELRTPLNSLLILAKMFAANEDGNLTAEQVEEAQIIHSGGQELLNLINDILDLSKVEAGKISLIPEEVSFDQILLRMEKQFTPVARQSGIAFSISQAENLPLNFFTDTQRVEQILKNLLSNAFKFTQNGSVALRVSRVGENIGFQRSTLNYENAVAFSVTDTGIGIDQSKFRDIFEAFQQEDGSVDRHYGGTGLGLTIARKFAHILGGEIYVESQKGKGSIFTLILPAILTRAGQYAQTIPVIAEKPAIPAEQITQDAEIVEFIADDRKLIDEKDKTLLIIEDDKNFAAVLMKMAHRYGYKCLVAGDGRTGLLLAMRQPASAVILDLKLPDIDGMNILDQLKQNPNTSHIPVHIITGRENVESILPLRRGAIGYLTKPVTKEALDGVFSKIETLLRSKVKKVLVVEDDSNTQIAMNRLLKQKDVELTFCSKGMSALKQAQAIRFDCIILDLRLPDMTGFEWLEELERNNTANNDPETPPPIIIYTAQELTEEEDRQLSLLTSSIVIKGANSSERLLDEVNLFLHHVESTLSSDQQAIIRMQHDPDKILQGRTALLVDDDLRNTFALSKLFKKRGLNVIIADNGQMALDRLETGGKIDIVIMDIMMPVMDGYQAMQAIRAQETWQGIPIIALTARALPEEQEKCLQAGANDYLTKPVDIERLLTLMRLWLFKQELAA